MENNDIKVIALDRGYQLLFNGESAGTFHQHKNHWTGTIGGSVTFSHSNSTDLIIDMVTFIKQWRSSKVGAGS